MWNSEFYAKFKLCKIAIADNWLTFHCDASDRTEEEQNQNKTDNTAEKYKAWIFTREKTCVYEVPLENLRCGL